MATTLAPTLTIDDVAEGQSLPELAIPLDRTLIVASAIATRDYQDVHHDPDIARAKGNKDIFMNILSTNGFVGRYVTDWTGPNARLTSVGIRLGVPNYPGDTMTMRGTITSVDTDTRQIGIRVVGSNSMGDHVTGAVTAVLPA